MRSNSQDVLPSKKIRIYKGDHLSLSVTKTEGVSWAKFLEESNIERRVLIAIKAGQQSSSEELAIRICSIFREYTKAYSNECLLSSSGIISPNIHEGTINRIDTKFNCLKSEPYSYFLGDDLRTRKPLSNNLASFTSKPEWETSVVSSKEQTFGLNNLKISINGIIDRIKPNLLEEEIHRLKKDIRDCFNDLHNARKFFKALNKLAVQIIPEGDSDNITNNVHNLWSWLKGFLERYMESYKVGLNEPRDNSVLRALGCEDARSAIRKVDRLLEDSRRLWEIRAQLDKKSNPLSNSEDMIILINRILT